LWIDVRDAQ
jgi:uncharacterized protein DUF4167